MLIHSDGDEAGGPPAASVLGALAGLANHLCPMDHPGPDLGAARTALRLFNQELAQGHPRSLRDTWPERLLRGGEALGLSLSRLRCAPRALLEGRGAADAPTTEVEVPLPLLTLTRDGAFLLLTERAGQRVRAQAPEGPETGTRMLDAAGLADVLGLADPDTPAEFVLARPAAPLWALRDPHGGDHHAGDGHAAHGPSPQRRLWALLRSEANDLWVVLVYAVAVGVLSLAMPVAVQSLVNSVAFGALLQPLLVISLLLLSGLALSGVLRTLQTYVVEILQQRLFVRAALDLAYRLPRVRRSTLRAANGPELVNRFFDVVTVQKSVAGLLLDGLALALQALIGLLVLAFYHPALLAFDIVLLLSIAVILFLLGRGAVDTAIRESRAKYAVAAWLEELVRHPLAFRAQEEAAFAAQHADDLARSYLLQRRAHFRVLLRQIIASLALYALAAAALLGIGGALVIARQLTIGQLVAAELLVGAVLSSFAKFGKHLESYYDLLAAVDKLGHLVDLPLEPVGGERLPPSAAPAALRLRGVHLPGLAAAEHAPHGPLPGGLELTLEPGARATILGAAGSGKSTLAEVLYGLRPPAAGAVELDGVEVRETQLSSLRAQVALLRGPEIFEGTLAENITVGRQAADAAALRWAIAAAGLRDVVSALPQGQHTHLSGGGLLSHSQAVRLMVARAIVCRPRLLIVDDVLSGLDPATLAQLRDVLFDPDAPWTLLVLSREASPLLLQRSDRVLTLRDAALHDALEVR